MSIASEIQRIKNNIANAYTVILEKGGVLPSNKNSSNLANTINSISSSAKYGITVDNFLGDVDSNGLYKLPISGTLNATGIKKVDDYGLACKFGGSAWGTTRVQGLTHIIFPDLTYVGNGAMGYFYTYSTDLETISFPELVEIGQCGMQNAFQWNYALKSASFPKLRILSGMYYSLSNAFNYCQNLEYVNLNSLEQMTSQALSSAFSSCRKLQELSFPSLNKNSFGNYTDQFNRMLSGVSECTVHFPIRIKKTIENWSDVISGFGGTNTVILFDLSASTVNFTSNSDNYNLYIDKDLIEESTILLPAEDAEYLAHDNSANKVLVQTLTNLVENETKNEFIDFNQNSRKIKIITNHGTNVYFDILGVQICAVEESNGNFAINYIGNNIDISYFIDGGDNYTDATGTISVQNNNVSQNITLSNATISNFSRPNLSANGTMGGNSFAVSCDSSVSGYSAYYAVDGNTDYLWMVNNTNSICKYTFYNPIPLKVSQIVNYYTSTTYSASNFTVEGSNDNENWTEIGTYTVSKTLTQTIPVNSTRYFKYHRIAYKNSTIRLKDLGITATQKG